MRDGSATNIQEFVGTANFQIVPILFRNIYETSGLAALNLFQDWRKVTQDNVAQ